MGERHANTLELDGGSFRRDIDMAMVSNGEEIRDRLPAHKQCPRLRPVATYLISRLNHRAKGNSRPAAWFGA